MMAPSKKRFLILLVAMAGLALLFVLGPRPTPDLTLHTPSLPDDLEGYLARTEATVPNIRPGTEKTIVWADTATRQQTPLSIVYLHGFSAARQEVRPLCDTLAARLGANLFYTRLTGHGRDADALGEATVNDWLNDGYEALAIGRRLGGRVVLVGASTGATLATWLAAHTDTPEVAALVLISPNYRPRDPDARFLLWPWGEAIARLVVGEYRTWTPFNESQARYWTTRYPSKALVTMMSLVDLVAETDLGTVQHPVLTLYSTKDAVVSAEAIAARFPEFGASYKQLVPVDTSSDPSHHVIAGDVLSPGTTEPVARAILNFLRPVLEGR